MCNYPTIDNPRVERFHRCNARVVSWYDSVNGVYVWRLISYQSHVVELRFKTPYESTARPTGELINVVLTRYAKYSNSTWRQVSRFLNEYGGYAGERCTYTDVAKYQFNSKVRGYDVCGYGDLLLTCEKCMCEWAELPWVQFNVGEFWYK